MKYLLSNLLFVFLLIVGSPVNSLQAAAALESDAGIKKEQTLSKKEQRAAKKEFKKQLKKEIKDLRKENDTELVLLVILSVLLPPLAMALHDGITNRFWISILLTILFWVPGVIYTLIVILREN